jgi:anthranilate phosphoribosyltransferase
MTKILPHRAASALAPFVAIVARGPGRGRPLAQDEARAAMSLILSGAAAPEAVGALLMVLRLRHETAEEIAGFAQAARASLGPWQAIPADLDWPSYAAGKSRGQPYFLLAAILLASHGIRVVMHGYNSHMRNDGGTIAALEILGLRCALTPAAARADLDRIGFTYAPLAALSPQLLDLLKLRDVLGLRSCINTVLRALNPVAASATMIGVFHPAYLELQVAAARLMGQPQVAAFKGGGGEAERTPFKELIVHGLHENSPVKTQWPALIEGEHRRLNEQPRTDAAQLIALWRGEISDPIGEAIVKGTAAIALSILKRARSPAEADHIADRLWSQRDTQYLPLNRKAA